MSSNITADDTSSKVDTQIATMDFFDRLCLVTTTSSKHNAATNVVAAPNTEVETYKLWPALKFDGLRELVDHIRSIEGIPANSMNKFCAIMTIQYHRLVRSVSTIGCKSFGIAYLLGRGGGNSTTMVLLPKNSNGEIINESTLLFDFWSCCEEMSGPCWAEGSHCGAEEFQHAYNLALDRVMSNCGPSPEEAKQEVKEEKKATLTTVNSARKTTFSNVEESEKKVTLTTINSGRKTFSNLEESPFKKKRQQNQQEQSPEKKEDESATLPVKTVEFSGMGGSSGSVSSPEAPLTNTTKASSPQKYSDDESQSEYFRSNDNENDEDGDDEEESEEEEEKEEEEEEELGLAKRKSNRCSPAPTQNLPWGQMWTQMRNDGWWFMPGSGLVEWYYVHPTCAGMKKTDVLKEKTEGEDYFTSEESVKRYARVSLGWRTECRELCSESPKDAEMADRIKKRKRGVQQQQAVVKEAPKPASVEEKKKKKAANKNNNNNNKAKGKKQAAPKAKNAAKSAAVQPPPTSGSSSPENQGSDDDSRFSGGEEESEASVAHRTRSKADSPTISELEVDLGVKKSAKKGKRQLQFPQEEDGRSLSVSSSSTASRGSSGGSGSSDGSSASGTTSSGGGSETQSEQSSVDATYRVMASSAAWRLLQDRFGFSYHQSSYCLPGKENRPGKDSSAVEGMNYFGTLADLRKQLCAYGLPECKKYLSEEEGLELERWVRYANVVGLPDAQLINPADVGEPLSHNQVWPMLVKLGLRFSCGRYIVANADPSEPPFRFERQQDYQVHLARFGIPRVEGFPKSEKDRLSKDQRFKLDLYIANTTMVDTFKRINPGSENVNEITPRRTRRGRSNAIESELAKPVEQRITEPSVAPPKQQVPKRRKYQIEFNELEIQRSFPAQLLTSQEALSMLIDNYNFSVLKRDGEDYYCLPGVELTEGEDSMLGIDYFDSVRGMRENLCAFGLPPVAKGPKMSEASMNELTSWVRCAHIDAIYGDGAVPECAKMKPNEARAILKGLGYSFSDNFNTVLLPEIEFHNFKLGVDGFDKLVDLFNHIARFGLAVDETDSELSVSEEDRLKLEVFVASVATFDVCKRIRCDAPIKNKASGEKEQSVATAPSAAKALDTAGDAEFAVTKAKTAATPTPQAAEVVEDDQDTPQASPPKKPRTNTLTKYFTAAKNAVVDVVAALSSPNHYDTGCLAPPDQNPAGSSPVSSTMSALSPSCLHEKGDEEIEACLAGAPEGEEFTAPESAAQESELLSPNNQMKAADSMGQAMSLDNGSDAMHYPQAVSPHIPWTNLWTQMRKSGWGYKEGNGLVAWYWVHPVAAKMGKGEMLRECTEGIHYFTTEHDMHRYAMNHLGWAGSKALSPTPSDMSMTSRVKKRKQANAVKSDSSSPQKRTQESSEAGGKEVGSPPEQSSPTKKSRSSPRNETRRAAKSSPGKSPGSKTSDSASVNSQSSREKDYQAPPDQEPTVRDKLECCQMVLHPNFKQFQLSKSASVSVVSSKEDDIKDFMTKSIETGLTVDGMTIPSPGFMYICGGPGTGKTTAVMSCADEIKKWAKRNGYDKPHFCTINMAASSTSSTCNGGIMRAMLKRMAVPLGLEKDANLTAFEKQFKKKVLVLVLDEIDMMFKQHGGRAETWFRTLVDWAENKEYRFSIIGISNSVNDVNSKRIREMGHSPRELVFSAYREEDILAILEQRLGKTVVDHKALQLISRRVAASSGDARRALEITSNAVGKCAGLLTEEKLDMEVTSDDECMPLVKLPHMMRAIREGMPMRHGEVISGLPQAAKVILCIAVSLSHVWGPTAEISVSTLKHYCVEATHHAVMDELGVGHVMSLVEMLIDSGLLITGSNRHFNPQDINAKLKIGVQLDDVEIALEESLLKEGGFYRSLVDYVKRECILK